jgi:hypothetical protein
MSAVQSEVAKPKRQHSAETRRRIGESKEGYVPPLSERVSISESKAGVLPKEATKAKMSAAKEGRAMPDETKEKIGKTVKEARSIGMMGKQTRFLTLIASGQSVREAAQTVGYSTPVAYELANNVHFRQAILDATVMLRATLYTKMPELLDLSFQTLADTMRSPTARHEVKVKAAAHTLQLAMFLATADKNFQPPPPSPEDLALIEGEVAAEE